MKKFIIYMINDFEFRCGGLVVQYELANILNNFGVDISIISPNNIQNSILFGEINLMMEPQLI
jgi:hypothetical protein